MKISAIIPTFNRASLVCEAVESVLVQTLPVQEIMVVDDGSTDDTSERLKEFGDRIKIIRQENRGISAARNAGIENTTGDWLAFLDSDDVWKPNKLARQTEYLQDFAGYKICYTDEEWRKNGQWFNPKKVHQKYSGDIYRYAVIRCFVSASSILMHRRLFDQHGLFDEALPACEDYDLWLRLAAHERFLLLPEKLVIKRDGPWEQLSHQRGLDKYRILALEKILQSGELNKEQERLTKIELLQKCRIYAAGAEKHGRSEEAEWARAVEKEYCIDA